MLPAKVTLEIGGDTVVSREEAGGGGWGDPARRDPQAIAADLRNGKICAIRAAADYGRTGKAPSP